MAIDPVARAEELHRRAVLAQDLGHHRTALTLLSRAQRALVDAGPERAVTTAAAVWITVALNEAELYGVERGLQALAEARAWAERAGSPGLLVRVHNQTGLIASRAGRWSSALVEFQRALELLEHAESHDHYAILANLGTLQMMRGELMAARPLLTRAAQFAHDHGLAEGEMKALHNLGYLEYLRGDLPRALELIDAADRLPVDVGRGVLLLDRARILLDAGLLHQADESLLAAQRLFEGERLAQDVGEAELERARCALLSGDVAHARRLAARARTRFRRRGNDQSRRSAELVLLGGDLAAGRPGRRLVPPALRLEDEFAAAGLTGPARVAGLLAAEALLDTGSVDEATATVSRVGPPSRQDPLTLRLQHHYVRARLDEATGKRSKARARIGRALTELATYQGTFGSIDLSTAAAVHGRRLAALDLTIALRSGRPADVFHAAERSRAVTSRLAAVTPPEDPHLAGDLAELRQVVESARAVANDPDAQAGFVRRRAALERAISERRWTLRGTGDVRPPVWLPDLLDTLAGRALALLLESGGRLHAVRIHGGAVDLVDLGSAAPVVELGRRVRADLDVLAQPRLPGALRGAVLGSYTRSLNRLDERLLRPLHLDGEPVVLSTTGSLGQLPWSHLPSRRGHPTVITPSATAWVGAGTAAGGPVGDVIAFAGPDVGAGPAEVAGVRDSWPDATVTTGADATGEALAKAMATADVVHIAAHGTHETENPLFSCLRLADGPVFAHELDHLGRAPEHVVLSACELGLATVRPGDEALGLTSVLLRLGTRSVVAGVARVGDDLAATTMTAYHRRLAGGTDSATALAGALAENDPDQPAPFVCFGAAWSAGTG